MIKADELCRASVCSCRGGMCLQEGVVSHLVIFVWHPLIMKDGCLVPLDPKGIGDR